MTPRWLIPLLVAACASSSGTSALAATQFTSADRNIECTTALGAHGSAIDCVRMRDGRQATVYWAGVYFSGGGYPTGRTARGWILRPGSTRVLRLVDVTYRCSAPSRSRVRCVNTQLGIGILIGDRLARRVRS